MADVIPAPTPVRIPVRGGGHFPVRRVYCVGRNFADHAREMGATAPASKDERGQPVFFLKPADAVVPGGDVPYPPGTQDLHHEVELVVALGQDAPPGVLDAKVAAPLVHAYGIGLDLTRRDLLAAAQEAAAPVITYGAFIQTIIDFVLIAFVIFLIVRSYNRMRPPKADTPAPPSEDILLLREIRDSLKQRTP